LKLVSILAGQLDGHLEVHRPDGIGAMFSIHFPCLKDDTPGGNS